MSERIVAERLIQQLHAARVAGDLTGMCRVLHKSGVSIRAQAGGGAADLWKQPAVVRQLTAIITTEAGDGTLLPR